MATGLIGISTAQNSTASSTVNGATLNYTCPASGVRYAVVAVVASCVVATATGILSQAVAGSLKLSTASSGTYEGDSASLSYSVILAPGQTWTGETSAMAGNGGITSATLQASVLEVV